MSEKNYRILNNLLSVGIIALLNCLFIKDVYPTLASISFFIIILFLVFLTVYLNIKKEK